MNVTSMGGITVEVLMVADCLHCGRTPHRLSPDGSVEECMACLQRPTRYSLPRGGLAMTEQIAMTLAADGMALSIEPLSDGARADFARIIRDFIASGHPFSADELREALDAAGIPTSARGGLMAGAIRSGLIREVGMKRSVHPATHGKRIGVYEGPDRTEIGTVTPPPEPEYRCPECGAACSMMGHWRQGHGFGKDRVETKEHYCCPDACTLDGAA